MSYRDRVHRRFPASSVVKLSIAAGVTLSMVILAAPHAGAAAGSASIRVTPVRQAHNLDCEAAALQVALAAIGINVTQDSILANTGDDPRRPLGTTGHPSRWGNPNTSFVGDVNEQMIVTGYGVYGSPTSAARAAERPSERVGGRRWRFADRLPSVGPGHTAQPGSSPLLAIT